MYKKYDFNESFFKTITAESAYVLGWIMSDGCINYVKDKRYQIRLELKDKDILEKINKLLDSNIKIYNTSRATGRIGIDGKSDIVSTLHLLQISSKKMVKDLLDLGVSPNKTKRVCVPSSVKGKYVRHFIRGYFEGDGSIRVNINGKYKALRTYICSSNKDILTDIGDILKYDINLIPKIYKEKTKAGYDCCYKLSYGSKESYALCRYMYQDIEDNMYLNRKYEIYKNSLENKIGICVKKCSKCNKELVDVNGNTRYCTECKKQVLKDRDKEKYKKRMLQRKMQQEVVNS